MNQFNVARTVTSWTTRSFLVGLILGLLSVVANAQSATDGSTPTGMSPGAPAGSYSLTGFENVNLFNGHLNFHLPLLQVGGRGSAGYTINLNLERQWRTRKTPPNVIYPETGSWGGLEVGYSPGVLLGRVVGAPTGGLCEENEGWRDSLTRLTFIGADGTEYQLIDKLTMGVAQQTYYNVDCSIGYNFNRGKVFVTHDGSAVTFISDANILDAYGFAIEEIRPSGFLLLKDGTRYRIDGGVVTSIQDRNGNKVTVAGVGRTVTDSLNRVVTVAYSYDSNPALNYDQISFKGTGGAARTIRIWKSSLSSVLRSGFSIQTWQQLFPEMNGSGSSQFNPLVVSSVELPDGRRYYFKYNPYGELARVELPTGGAIEYDYAAGLRSGVASGSYGGGGAYTTKQVYRRVVERRIYKDSSSVYESKMTISRPENSVTETDGYVLVEQRSYAGTLLASDKHYFYGTAIVPNYQTPLDYSFWKDGRELKTESLSLTGSVLRAVEHTWANSGGNPQITQSVSTLSDTNQVAKQTFLYDQYNNKTDVYEYDYGTGAAGALVRRTHTDFLTTNSVNSIAYDTVNPSTSSPDPAATVHLRSLPTQTQVFDAGGTEKARTTFEYDYYVNTSPRAYLVPRTGISGLDSASTTGYTPRGNVTRATSWILSTSAQIHSYPQYDIAGNVVKATDPLGNATEFFFEDRFGTPDGEAQANSAPSQLGGLTSYAFVTKVKNAANHYSYTQYDYHLGRAVDAEDPNGVVSSGYSVADLLDRPTKVIRAVGTAAQNQTVFAYDDVARKITTTSDLNTSGDAALVSMMFYDGLGRTVETRQYEGGTNYIATQQQYDALGRAYKGSNPFRPWQSESAVWTTSGFDALGRVITVTTPDSAVVNTSYSGNTVTVTDQAGKARKSVPDALGRLIEVYENPNGLNYLTSYTYDVLDNLTGVTQGTQTRTFVYDSLKRLTSATNPESGAIAYQYDANGNLLVKTDARNVSTHFSYDVLNRVQRRWYNGSNSLTATTHNSPALPSGVGSSDEANYVYDSQSLPAGAPSYSRGSATGRLVATTYGSGSSAGDYLAFDVLGRGTLKIQQTGGINYQVQYGYNIGSGLTSQTYPSGRTVTYTYDSAGRTSSFAGNLGDSVSRTYTQGIIYSPLGGMTKEQFGTDTPLYNKSVYNNRGQLSEIRVSTNASAQPDWNRGAILNQYSDQCNGPACNGTDNNGNLKRQEVFIPHNDQASTYTNWLQQYDYDNLNRLQRVKEISSGSVTLWQQEYEFDRWGNRKVHQTNTWGPSSGPLIPKPNFEVETAKNRLYAPGDLALSESLRAMQYDAAGNLKKDSYTGAGDREHDAENRMTKAWANGQWQYYTYNADGQRVRRKVDGVETWQVYGMDGELLAEYAASGVVTSPQKEYGYRNGQLLVTAEPRANVALAANGAVGTASSTHSSGYSAAGANNGERKGAMWGSGAGWNDATLGAFPDWLQIEFNGSKTIDEIDVFSVQDNYGNPVEPTETMTFSFYGLTTFEAQYWNGSSWATLPGGSISGNNKVWRKITFSPVTTSKIRVHISAAADGYSRITEVEAWGGGSANIEWLVADQLGTPRMVVNKTGSLAGVKRHDYLPFGEELYVGIGSRTFEHGYTGDAVRQKFTKKERDNETGLDYFIHRYRSSTQGRYLSPDMLFADQSEEDPQSWNLYSYVGNNPVNFTDPFGLWKQVACDNGGQCWQSDRADDTYESLTKIIGGIPKMLARYFQNETITRDHVFDVSGFQAWQTQQLNASLMQDIERTSGWLPMGGGMSRASAGRGLLSKIGSWLGLGQTAQSGAARNIGGITAAQAAKLKELLEKIPGTVKVRAFGSRTTGAFTQNSDLDIAILGNVDKANPNTLRAVQEAQRYAESIGIGTGKGYRPLDINVYKSVQEMQQAFRNGPLFDAARGVPKLVGIE